MKIRGFFYLLLVLTSSPLSAQELTNAQKANASLWIYNLPNLVSGFSTISVSGDTQTFLDFEGPDGNTIINGTIRTSHTEEQSQFEFDLTFSNNPEGILTISGLLTINNSHESADQWFSTVLVNGIEFRSQDLRSYIVRKVGK
jgi:hypothetical protein